MKSDFKTYRLLNELSIVIRKTEDDELILLELNKSVEDISTSLRHDFFQLFKQNIEVQNSIIYFNDIHYRQSSTGFGFKVFLKENKKINIYIECLVDFQKIYFSCRSDLNEVNKSYISYCIKKAYGLENNAELRKIEVSLFQKLKFILQI